MDATTVMETDKPRRFTSLKEVAAHHGLEIHTGVILEEARDRGWWFELATPRYVPSAEQDTLEYRDAYAAQMLADLLYGIDSQCQDNPGHWKHVTTMITQQQGRDGVWATVFLK